MSNKPAGEMSFLDHLEVMRWHLVRSIAAIVILALVAFVIKSFLLPRNLHFLQTGGYVSWEKFLTCNVSASTRTLLACKP